MKPSQKVPQESILKRREAHDVVKRISILACYDADPLRLSICLYPGQEIYVFGFAAGTGFALRKKLSSIRKLISSLASSKL